MRRESTSKHINKCINNRYDGFSTEAARCMYASYSTESLEDMFARLGVPWSSRPGTQERNLRNFIHNLSDEELLKLRNDRYNGLLTPASMLADIEHEDRNCIVR